MDGFNLSYSDNTWMKARLGIIQLLGGYPGIRNDRTFEHISGLFNYIVFSKINCFLKLFSFVHYHIVSPAVKLSNYNQRFLITKS